MKTLKHEKSICGLRSLLWLLTILTACHLLRYPVLLLWTQEMVLWGEHHLSFELQTISFQILTYIKFREKKNHELILVNFFFSQQTFRCYFLRWINSLQKSCVKALCNLKFVFSFWAHYWKNSSEISRAYTSRNDVTFSGVRHLCRYMRKIKDPVEFYQEYE